MSSPGCVHPPGHTTVLLFFNSAIKVSSSAHACMRIYTPLCLGQPVLRLFLNC